MQKIKPFLWYAEEAAAAAAFYADPFKHAVSFVDRCDDQCEIDPYWNALIADGGKPEPCGWLKDRDGLSWQIVPAMLGELTAGADKAKSKPATDRPMTMGKIDIAALEAA